MKKNACFDEISSIDIQQVVGGCYYNCHCAYHHRPGDTSWHVPSPGICAAICCTGDSDQYYSWAEIKKECQK